MALQIGPNQSNQEPQTGDQVFLIFLSHTSEVKSKVQGLKEGLEEYGVQAFVAHSDIYPGTEWQEEILAVLDDMDAFVPILTKDFRDSDWTDQEVGYAIAKEVPIIPLKLEMDPYGFMGKYQAITCGWKDTPRKILQALTIYPRYVDHFIAAVAECSSFATANRLAAILPYIDELTEKQITALVKAFNENSQVNRSYGFRGNYPDDYGIGLATILSELTGRKYVIGSNRQGLGWRIEDTRAITSG